MNFGQGGLMSWLNVGYGQNCVALVQMEWLAQFARMQFEKCLVKIGSIPERPDWIGNADRAGLSELKIELFGDVVDRLTIRLPNCGGHLVGNVIRFGAQFFADQRGLNAIANLFETLR